MLMNTGTKMIHSKSGLISTIAWSIDGKVDYALEGSVFIAGAVIRWLRDGLKIINSSEETEQIAIDAKDNHGVYFVPAFTGLGAPYWDTEAKAAIVGLTLGVTDKHIVRAALESLAFQTKDVINAMMKDSGFQMQELHVDGGAANNNFLMQFQSDILKVKIIRPKQVETTSLGAALLAGLSIGFWTKEEIANRQKSDKEFISEMSIKSRNKLYKDWKAAVERVKTK